MSNDSLKKKIKAKRLFHLLLSTFFIFTVFQMAAVTMGFGDPLSPLQSVNRLLNFLLCAFPMERTVTLLLLVALATTLAF